MTIAEINYKVKIVNASRIIPSHLTQYKVKLKGINDIWLGFPFLPVKNMPILL